MSVLDTLGLTGMRAADLARDIALAQRALRRSPQTLTQWARRYGEVRSPKGGVVVRGGIGDDRGDIGDLQDTARGFARITNQTTGRPLDDAAQAAWERGFFPDHAERPSINDFLRALDGDLRGVNPRVSQDSFELLAEQEGAHRMLNDLDAMGVNTSLSGKALIDELKRHGAYAWLLSGPLAGAGILGALSSQRGQAT